MWPFKPKIPITIEDKEWTEVNILWLRERFGPHPDIITPHKDIFFSEFNGSETDIKSILDIVCTQMMIPTDNLELRFFETMPLIDGITMESEEDLPEGIYYQSDHGRQVIELNNQQLGDLTSVIATIAHEVAHIKLMTLGDAEEDEEYLTDLTAIYFGFGIFIGNSAFSFNQWQDEYHHKWSMKQAGYLPIQVIAYAIALLYPNIADSDWTNYLKKDLKKQVKQSRKFING